MRVLSLFKRELFGLKIKRFAKTFTKCTAGLDEDYRHVLGSQTAWVRIPLTMNLGQINQSHVSLCFFI